MAVAHKVLDLYASVLGQSDSIDELFLKLHRQVSTAQCSAVSYNMIQCGAVSHLSATF